jgi:hypothetical protein
LGSRSDERHVAHEANAQGRFAPANLNLAFGELREVDACRGRHRFGDHELAPEVLRQVLQPRGDVDRVTDDREHEAFAIADLSEDHGTRVEADADLGSP